MEKCQRCGKEYETVYRVPKEIWAKISPKSNGNGLLCIKCADEVAREKGIELYWEAKEDRFPCEQWYPGPPKKK